MPLVKSSSKKAFVQNLKAEIAAGRPQKQALAIAYRVKDDAKKKKMARGGTVGYAPGGGIPFYLKEQATATGSQRGIVASATPGRADKVSAMPRGGSYILPADIVSAVGGGNTLAGAKGLNKLFGASGPHGIGLARVGAGKRPGKFADGGDVDGVPIMASGGEYIVDPDAVAQIGGGDMKRGHDILDDFVKHTRKKAIKTLSKLPGPKKR